LRFGSQFYSLDATFVPGGGLGFNDSLFFVFLLTQEVTSVNEYVKC